MNRGSLSADDGTRTVCFVARSDFESRPGGDTVQWRMYERVAREAGLRATTWFDDLSIPPADVYHAFNVDRPLELYPKLAEVKRRGRPFILSTIHHPHEWMTKYYMSQPSGALSGACYAVRRWGAQCPLGRRSGKLSRSHGIGASLASSLYYRAGGSACGGSSGTQTGSCS